MTKNKALGLSRKSSRLAIFDPQNSILETAGSFNNFVFLKHLKCLGKK